MSNDFWKAEAERLTQRVMELEEELTEYRAGRGLVNLDDLPRRKPDLSCLGRGVVGYAVEEIKEGESGLVSVCFDYPIPKPGNGD